jgi:hypothetical protein
MESVPGLLIAHVYVEILKRHTYNNTPNMTGKLVLVIHLSIIPFGRQPQLGRVPNTTSARLMVSQGTKTNCGLVQLKKKDELMA